MKKIILTAAAAFALLAFRAIQDNSEAKAEQIQGVYIFHLSKPVQPYTYLGSIKKGAAWEGKPTEMLNSQLKNLKKDYPGADGIIFTTLNMDKADAIKFTDK